MNAAAPDADVTAVPDRDSSHLRNARRPPVARSDNIAASAVTLVLVLVFSVVGLPAISRGPRVPFVAAVPVRLPACAEEVAEETVLAVPHPERRAAIVVLPSAIFRVADKGEAGRRRIGDLLVLERAGRLGDEVHAEVVDVALE